MVRSGRLVKTISGEYGVTYNDDKSIHIGGVDKVPVYLLLLKHSASPNNLELASAPLSGKKILADPKKLVLRGFID